MSIFDLFSSSSGEAAAARAKQAAVKAAQQGFQAQAAPLKKGKTEALGYEQQALAPWQDIFAQGQALAPTYFGASGVGTPEQIAEAKTAWESSIPYQQFEAGVPDIYEAALRRGGLTGQTGQIPIDLNTRLMASLNQFYQPWQATLDPYKYLTSGATGETGVYGKEADIATSTAQALANAAANKYSTIGAARAAYPQNVYAAQSGASANLLNALFGIAQLGSTALGGGSLKNLFSGTPQADTTELTMPETWGTTTTYG